MRLRGLLCVAGLYVATAVATADAFTDKFQLYHSRARSSSPLSLDEEAYDDLTSAPRDYSVAILLTAGEAKYGCKVCKEIAPEWNLVAQSWVKGDGKGQSRTLYGTLDFKNGKRTFQKLNLQTAPVLLLFPPTDGPGSNSGGGQTPFRYLFQSSQSAEQIHQWVSRHLPKESEPKPPVVRPFNYTALAVTVTVVLGSISLLTVAQSYVLPVIQNRNLWAAISLVAILIFTSGHMFNHIRRVPYISGNGKGGITYFAGGFQTQFGMETQVIAAIYGLLSFCIVSLALKVPRMTDPRSQQVAVVVWSSIIWGTYSLLLSIFRIKNGGYPFWLPPF